MEKLFGKSLRKNRILAYSQIISPPKILINDHQKNTFSVKKSHRGYLNQLIKVNATNNKKFQHYILSDVIY